MRQKLLPILLLLFCSAAQLLAQDIVVNFSGTANGSAAILDSVRVENLESRAFIMLKSRFSYTIKQKPFFKDFENNTIKVFPNPAEQEHNIEFLVENAGPVAIRTYNTTGQLVTSTLKQLDKGMHQFKFAPDKKGIYLINVILGGKSYKKTAISSHGTNSTSKLTYTGLTNQKDSELKVDNSQAYQCTGYYKGQTDVLTEIFSSSKNYAFKFEEAPKATARLAGPLRANSIFDFNGDGKEDLMKMWNDNGQFTADVHLSDGSSFHMQRWATQQGGYWDEMKWFVGDFNRDGKTDLMKIWNDNNNFTADVHISTGSSFVMQRWATQQGGYWDAMQWFVGDFNGDGYTDIMKHWNDGGNFTADVHLSNGSSFYHQRWATQQGGYWDGMVWNIGDFNGDGMVDLIKHWNDNGTFTADVHYSTGGSFELRRWATQQGAFGNDQKWYVGDFNGDGLTDMMKHWNDNGYFSADVHVSNGGGFIMQRWATQQGGYSYGMQWFVGDYNGDGYSDLMKHWDDNGNFTADVHLSGGNYFYMQRWATQQGGYWNGMSWYVGDFNGDGYTDAMKLWQDNGNFTADVHPSVGSGFIIQRMATQQGGNGTAQKWSGPDGYMYSPTKTLDLNHQIPGATFVLYPSEYDAVQAAVGNVWENSINEGLEYGGVIYKINGANLWGFVSIKGSKHEIETNGFYPSVSEVTAYWHTHPNRASTGPSPADLLNALDEIKMKRLYTIVFDQNKRSTPKITSFGPTADASGRKAGMITSGSQSPQNYTNAAAAGALVCVLDSRTNQTYSIQLNDMQKSAYIKGTALIVGVKYVHNGNTITFNVGPLGISTKGTVSVSVGGTLLFVNASGSGGINIPSLLKGNWKEVLSLTGSRGVGAGAEVGGIGLAGSAGEQVTITFKEEGPGNSWGDIRL